MRPRVRRDSPRLAGLVWVPTCLSVLALSGACGPLSEPKCTGDGTFTFRVVSQSTTYLEAGTVGGVAVAPGDPVQEAVAVDTRGQLPVGTEVHLACVYWTREVPPDNDGTVHRMSAHVPGELSFEFTGWQGETVKRDNPSRQSLSLWAVYNRDPAPNPDNDWRTDRPTSQPGGASVELDLFSAFFDPGAGKWLRMHAEPGGRLPRAATEMGLEFEHLDFVHQGTSVGSGLQVEYRLSLEQGAYTAADL